MTIVVCEWDAPTISPFATWDVIIPGGLFSNPQPDPNIQFYEFERFDSINQEWLLVGNFRTPRAEFSSEVFENATVRIRAILKDGTPTPFVVSGNFQLYGTVFDFRRANSQILLSII